MSFPRFLELLWTSGRVIIGEADDAMGDDVLAEASELLHQLEALWRQSLAANAPDFDASSALWGAQQVYRAVRWIGLRNYDEQVLQAVADSPTAGTHRISQASLIYSVDLTMRFLPDLVRLGQTPADDDPLPPTLLRWARAWPLSSVGIQDGRAYDKSQLDVILSHETLRTLYIDRIVLREDTQRLDDIRVADALRETLGVHASLSPQLYAALHCEEGEAGT